MAKLLKLRRGTTSQHSSFTGAEGEVTIDLDKDVPVVHDGSTAGGHPVAAEDLANVSSATIAGRLADDAIAVSKISGGTLPSDVKVVDANVQGNLTIENADVINTAAIAGTKISPDFGSQNITTTGDVSCEDASLTGNITITNTNPKIILNDSNNNSDFEVQNDNGNFNVEDTTNTANRLRIDATGGVNIPGNTDFGAGIDVTGNITVTGTVDGVDVAGLHAATSGLSTGSGVLHSSVTIANGVVATTQSAGDNSTKVATTAYADTAISNLVDSSPSALNTLNELAAAIGDDANFSTTITNSIATKMPLSGGEFTGNVTCENITPDADSFRNLGTNSVRFATIYADSFVGSGANLTGVESFVSGMILLWSGSTGNIPSGFVLCNGSNSTPDLRDRFVVGAGNSYSVGGTGGAANVTLSTSQMPSHSHSAGNHTHSFNAGNHSHSFSGSGSSSHSHGISGGYSCCGNTYGPQINGNNAGPTSGNTNSANVSLSVSGNTGNASVSGNTGNSSPGTNSTGGGGDHENRPPYYALCYIMKT